MTITVLTAAWWRLWRCRNAGGFNVDYSLHGNSDLQVSKLCFGVMTFVESDGWSKVGRLGQHQADELVSIALDKGVNLFDTADVHHEGQSEQILGQALGPRRKDVIIATKCGFRMGPGPNDGGFNNLFDIYYNEL